MSHQQQLRRDTSGAVASVVLAAGEPGFDVTNKRLIMGDGAALGGIPHPSFKDVVANTFTYAVAGGTGDALTLALAKSVGAYFPGMVVCLKASANNTGAATINVDGAGVKSIKKMRAGVLIELEQDDLASGGIYELAYDGTQFQLLSVTPINNTSAWEPLAIGSAANSPSLDFTSDITAEFETYAIDFCGVRPSTANTELWMRLSNVLSTSFNSGSSDYAHSRDDDSGTTGTKINVNADSKIVIASSIVAISAHGFSGMMFLHVRPNRSPLVTWQGAHVVDSGGTFARSQGAGYLRTGGGAQLDGLRFMFSSGNVSEGTIKLFGIRSAL